MNLDHQSTHITLDWDDITRAEFERRINDITRHPETSRLRWRASAQSGYHVDICLRSKIHVLQYRRKWGDDGRRITNDILNRPSHIHDVLWDSKRLDGIVWKAGPWNYMK